MTTHEFPYQLAQEAILLNRYQDAIPLLKSLTTPDSQFLLAYLHFWDDDLTRTDAIQQLKHLAENNHAEANYILATCPNLIPAYDFRLPETDSEFTYLQKAVELGSVDAIADLADCYIQGHIVAQDFAKAEELLDRTFLKTDPLHMRTFYRLGQLGLHTKLNADNNRKSQAILHCIDTVQYLDNPYRERAINIAHQFVKSDNVKPNEVEKMLVYINEQSAIKQTSQTPLWRWYLKELCLREYKFDLHGATFDMFCDFIFDHYPVHWREPNRFNWSRHAKLDFNRGELVRFYTKLFTNPDSLLEKYSIEQIKAGFGMEAMREWADWTIGCAMSHQETTPEEAEACIRAMYHLFVDLFNHDELALVGYMWWDIGYGACSDSMGARNQDGYREDPLEIRLQLGKASQDTMERVLNIGTQSAQEAAIHGIWDRHHPNAIPILERFLEENPNARARVREVASYYLEQLQARNSTDDDMT